MRTLTRRVEPSGHQTRLRVASRLSYASALTVLIVGTLASFGGLGSAASGTKEAFTAVKEIVRADKPQVVNRTAAQDQYNPKKVTICHNGHTITINQSALPAHLRHGDTMGSCGSGAVAGAGANRSGGGGGTLGAVGGGTNLPFTGISLGTTLLASLLLMTLGFVLRRRAGEKS